MKPDESVIPDPSDDAAIGAPDEPSSAHASDNGDDTETVPSPLNALDALGALDPNHVSIVAPQTPIDEDGAKPDDTGTPFQTIFRQAVLDEIRDHAESQLEVEVCGVLVGSVYENSMGAFAYVEGCIRGIYANGRTAQVTFTAETWQHIDREMEDKFPGRKIIGWYHTHPGFGIFLSEMDLFIQRNFFNARWQGAFVYDPHSKERGLFGWSGGEIVRQNFVVDSEKGAAVTEMAGPHVSPKAHAIEEGPAGGPPGNAAELTARIKVLEQRQRYMLIGMAALMLVAVVWPLVVLVVMSNSEAPPPPSGSPTAAVSPSGVQDSSQTSAPADANPASARIH